MRLFFTLLIFTSFTYFSNAQTYLNSTSVWKERNGGGGAGNEYFTTNDYTLTLPGDTAINGITYFKVLKEGVQVTVNWVEDTLVEQVPIYEFLQPIREENGKFYQWHAGIQQDVLFQDFNVEQGDTMFYDCFGDPEIVYSVDTVYIGNIARKRFHFSENQGFGSYTLIEGVGSSRGLFEHACDGFIFFEAFYTLQCISQDGQYFAVDDEYPCESPSPTKDLRPMSNILHVAPNPFIDNIQIELEANATAFEIRVMSLDGKIVFAEIQQNVHSKFDLELDQLSAGMYVLMIRTPEKIMTEKIIKQ